MAVGALQRRQFARLCNGNDKLAAIVKDNNDSIATKVLANEIVFGTDVANAKEWDINGEKVTIGVEKV